MTLFWPILEMAAIALGIYWIRKDAVARRRSWLLTLEIGFVALTGFMLAHDLWALATGGQVGLSL